MFKGVPTEMSYTDWLAGMGRVVSCPDMVMQRTEARTSFIPGEICTDPCQQREVSTPTYTPGSLVVDLRCLPSDADNQQTMMHCPLCTVDAELTNK